MAVILDGSQVLVTGGAGFVGSHLAEYLVAGGAHVTVIDDLRTGSRDNLAAASSHVELLAVDLRDVLCSQQGIVQDYDYVFHLAANPYIPPSVEDPVYDFEQNLHNTLLLLEAVRQAVPAPRLINVSSAAVYGSPSRLPIRESDPTVPISPYGVSKLAAERYVAVYSQIYGLWAVSLRLFSVYGPRQRKQVVYDLLRKLQEDPMRLAVLGDGSQIRDFCYVDDVVRALVLAATVAPGGGEAYNVASGRSHSIAELISVLCQVCKADPQVVYSGSVRPGDAERWTVDTSMMSRLGFVAQTPLKDGLLAVREWFGADG